MHTLLCPSNESYRCIFRPMMNSWEVLDTLLHPLSIKEYPYTSQSQYLSWLIIGKLSFSPFPCYSLSSIRKNPFLHLIANWISNSILSSIYKFSVTNRIEQLAARSTNIILLQSARIIRAPIMCSIHPMNHAVKLSANPWYFLKSDIICRTLQPTRPSASLFIVKRS